MEHLDHEERERFEKYVREVAEIVGLGGWDISFADDLSLPEECSAGVSLDDYKNKAYIKFTNNFFDNKDIHERRNTVLHELIHIHFNRMYYWAIERYADISAPLTNQMFKEELLAKYEIAVDALARVMNDSIPYDIIQGYMTKEELESEDDE